MALPIGITGNIGSGKTTVCRQFERLGVPVYYADSRAKTLMSSDPDLVSGITEAFGPEVYDDSGRLNRPLLAEKVFNNPQDLARLNGLVHPAVARDASRWNAEQTYAYTIHEAAIIFEIGSEGAYAAVVVVNCPADIRQLRVVNRDGMTAEDFRARADTQWSDVKKAEAANYLIDNSGKQLLLPQVLLIDAKLRQLARQANPSRT